VSDSNQPLWKREISLGRRKEAEAPPLSPLHRELEEIKAVTLGDVPVSPTPPPAQASHLQAQATPDPTPVPVPPPLHPPVPPAHAASPPHAPVPPVHAPAPPAHAPVPPAHVQAPPLEMPPAPTAPTAPTVPAEDTTPQAAVTAPLASRPQPHREPARATENKQPFWRKEISLRRRPKADRDDHAAPDPKPEPAKKEQKEKRERRGLSMPRLERPARRVKRDAHGRSAHQKRLVGLKIGASQLAAARVSNNGAPALIQVARAELDHGIVVGGELREPEMLAESLRAFFKEHDLPKRGVRLGIANNRIGVRMFEIADVADKKQLANAVKFRAQEVLPIPIEDAVLDYQVVGEHTDEEGRNVKRVLLVVAYRELVDRYISACRKAGLELVGIDLEAFALLRAMSAPPPEGEDGEAAVVVVSVGHERSTLAVSNGRVCEFTRVLEWGGWALNVALARVLGMTPSEAEPYKRLLDLDAPVGPPGWTAEQFAAARDAIVRQVQSFARELVSSLQFYQSQPDSLGIGEVVLTGGTAHLPGLAPELERLMGVSVRVGDPLARVKVGKKVGDEQIGSLAVAIGLGIED
jgi:type IV pilus assembly protein PilM